VTNYNALSKTYQHTWLLQGVGNLVSALQRSQEGRNRTSHDLAQ
jgi:hypothetical protein